MHSSPFNMRQQNLTVMKPPLSKNAAGSSKNSVSYITAGKSLDLLRQNIQRNINQEIQGVISKYIDIFFKPGIENIKNNLGPNAVTEDHISNMCRQILEEAKRLYPTGSSSPRGNSLGGAMEEQEFKPSTLQTIVVQQSQPQQDVKLPLTSPSFGIKRESDTDSEASSMSNHSKKAKKSKNNGNSSACGNSVEGNTSRNDSTSPPKPKKPSGPFRKHVALWDSNKLTIETMFIMGAKANKALGFAQTRGRLYVKHPGLFKYASDADDKEWLSKNKLMPATGGRAYIMLLDDIEKLAKDNALNVTINFEDIKGFKVPDFILDKMKSYINTWKKTYSEEDDKITVQRNRNSNAAIKPSSATATIPSSSSGTSATPQTSKAPATSLTSVPSNHIVQSNNVMNSTGIVIMNPPPPPPPPVSIHQLQQQAPQTQNHPPQQQTSTLSFIPSGNSNNRLYDTQFPATQPIEMQEYIHIEKPPPMYPGQPQHPMQTMGNPGGNYLHPNQLDPIEQAFSKGDWSQVSDRNLLQYALQSTRSIGSCWDPQDSFDLISSIESVTNGGLGGSGSMGETSPLLQISPNPGPHQSAPHIGAGSPSCELSAVLLDQVSAFQYTET